MVLIKKLQKGEKMIKSKFFMRAVIIIVFIMVSVSLFSQTREELMRRHEAGELPTQSVRTPTTSQPTLYPVIIGSVSAPSYTERLIVTSTFHPATTYKDKKGNTRTNPAWTSYSYSFTEGATARAQARANEEAKKRFGGNVVVTSLDIGARSNQEPTNAYVTFTPSGQVRWVAGSFIPEGKNKSQFSHNAERATVRAITEALKDVPKDAKIGSYIAQSRDMSLNNVVFDAIEETLFNLDYTNISDRTDIDVTRYEQQLREGFDFQDSSIVGFFTGADYVITARIDRNRVAVRILDVRTSTLRGRGTEDF
jgi:hypothetical protein